MRDAMRRDLLLEQLRCDVAALMQACDESKLSEADQSMLLFACDLIRLDHARDLATVFTIIRSIALDHRPQWSPHAA